MSGASVAGMALVIAAFVIGIPVQLIALRRSRPGIRALTGIGALLLYWFGVSIWSAGS